jgi:hypothetical protein
VSIIDQSNATYLKTHAESFREECLADIPINEFAAVIDDPAALGWLLFHRFHEWRESRLAEELQLEMELEMQNAAWSRQVVAGMR